MCQWAMLPYARSGHCSRPSVELIPPVLLLLSEITLLNKDLYPQGPSLSVFWGIVDRGQTGVGSRCEPVLFASTLSLGQQGGCPEWKELNPFSFSSFLIILRQWFNLQILEMLINVMDLLSRDAYTQFFVVVAYTQIFTQTLANNFVRALWTHPYTSYPTNPVSAHLSEAHHSLTLD